MALSGWTTGNYVSLGSALITAAPLTMACFGRNPTPGGAQDQTMLALNNSGSASNRNCFRLLLDSPGGNVRASTSDASSTVSAMTASAPSASTVFHAAGVWASASSRSAYLDGTNKVTDTSSSTPSGINRTAIGVSRGATSDYEFDSGGRLAEAGFWNAALTDEEIAALAKGVPPIMIRPQNLVAYLPLVRDLIDLKGNAFAITGSLTAADHTRTYAPF
jgi:hypothetical protein